MAREEIKAVPKVPAMTKSTRTADKRKKKQWGLHFLECLLEEIKEQEEKEAEERDEAQSDNKRGNACEIIVKTMEETVCCPVDSPVRMKRDTLELSGEKVDGLLTSELYTDIIDAVRCVGKWNASHLYKVADRIVKGYYDGQFTEAEVEELFRCCYEKGTEKANLDIAGKTEVRDKVFEYFFRVNARKCVMENEREGRFLVEGCGLSWAGTTYYNSDYYFRWKRIRMRLMRIGTEISSEERLPFVSFDEMEKQSEFYRVGGLTYHGVFVWIQQKDNYPVNQYGMRQMGKIPPEGFCYLYRNHFMVREEAGAKLLEQRMRRQKSGEMESLWRKFTLQDGCDYHNGMSYLLEGSFMDENEEAAYGEAMGFLQNFRLYRIAGCVELLRMQGGM